MGLKTQNSGTEYQGSASGVKNTGGLSFTTRFTPNTLLKDYEIYAKETADILRQSKIDLEQYQKKFGKLPLKILIFSHKQKKFKIKFCF